MISKSRLNSIRSQGYCNYTDAHLNKLAFGNRFAYILCTSIMAIGVITTDIRILGAMAIIAFASVLLPYHPFDYIYNHFIRGFLEDKPKLPKRSRQLKFACGLAFLWLTCTILLFANGLTIAGYVVGGLLISVATLVSTTDICLPSLIYNYIFRVKID